MKVRHSLFAKLSLGLLILLLFISVIYTVFGLMITRSYIQQVDQDLHHSLADDLVADRNLVKEGRINQEALKETFREYMLVNPSIELYLLDLQGNILSYSADPGMIKRHKVSLKPIFSFLDGTERYPLGDDPRSHDKKKPFSVTTVPRSDKPEGYLYVLLHGGQYEHIQLRVQDNYFIRLGGLALFISLLVGLFAGLFVFYFLTQRLRSFSQQIEAFESSGFTTELIPYPKGKEDEIDQINHTFESMAERIRIQFGQLEAKDTERRQLVAHISHDLRTPLTSMLGYIESLELKKASLTEAEQESFLAIAHKQGQRLSRMIETLFELSSLEAQDTEPAIETFVPAEWLYDVAQKHQLRIEQHGLNIEVDIQEQGLLALADISLLERVMDNLIDNSISHAKSSGTLTLRLATQGDKVAISVADQGKGIAKEEFVGLFEPLVTTEGPKKHDVERHHAGLGLAIAKRIMQLLDGDIFVKSELGVGTVFTLCLPKSR